MRLARRKLDRSRSRRYTRKPQRKRALVTVCIAAICQDPGEMYVVCAADRMLTAGMGEGDVEYEPDRMPKLLQPTSAIAVMVADDMFLQYEIILGVYPELMKRIAEQPQEWWTVREVADLY